MADQYNRKAELYLVAKDKALDLSKMHFRFQTSQEDAESPATVSVRVYNLAPETITNVLKEYSRVIVKAGYDGGAYGVIFEGTVRQFRRGKEHDAVTTYFDILAADGDWGYINARVATSLAAGVSPQLALQAATAPLKSFGVNLGYIPDKGFGGILPRGKVLFSSSIAAVRKEARNANATWSISNGILNVIPTDGYLPGDAVVLNSRTGLIGRVEQTNQGMTARCLLNPKIQVGGLVQIDNASINKTMSENNAALPVGQQRYDKYAGIDYLADVSADGLYRVYVAENLGDTRGVEWYTDLVCLAMDSSTKKVVGNG